jgi:KipI family sensor histidine kinase inhibitor
LVHILPAGDCALVVEFENKIAPEVNARVMQLCAAIKGSAIKGVVDFIPTFRSVLVSYDPLVISYNKLQKRLQKLSEIKSDAANNTARIFHIPVCYGGEFGEDIGDVAAHTGLSVDEVVAMHSEKPYLIYMLGFLPGFPYLGGLNEKLFTPRLPSPRTSIPAGSVGIGGEQTGIYPLASPGGWRLIGRTPLKPYDAKREEPILYAAGDYIKFDPVSETEYNKIEKAVQENTYTYTIEKRGT